MVNKTFGSFAESGLSYFSIPFMTITLNDGETKIPGDPYGH
jgi:hypothetical protein